MLMMKALYHSEQFTDDFEIDLAQKNGCKGVLRMEVQLHQSSVPLLLKDGTGQLITADTPFSIEAVHPIINGLFRFEFKEFEELQNDHRKPFKRAIVRYLYCE